LPVGVDLSVFDYGVNSGPSRSAKDLQHVVGAKVDGVIGAATIAAVKAVSPRPVIKGHRQAPRLRRKPRYLDHLR